jgi:hypothetical protein
MLMKKYVQCAPSPQSPVKELITIWADEYLNKGLLGRVEEALKYRVGLRTASGPLLSRFE